MENLARYIAIFVWICFALAGLAGVISGNPIHVLTLCASIFFAVNVYSSAKSNGHESR